MKITDRIKKLKKLVGSDVKYSYSDEFFTPIGSSSTIMGIQIDSLYDMSLIVKCKGVISPLHTVKRYEVFKVVKLPLVKINMGKHIFPVYNCIDQNVKTIFITKNDMDSSLIKEADYNLIDGMDEIKNKLKINLSVKKNFICDNEDKAISKIFNIPIKEVEELKKIGLSPYGWRNTLSETHIFNANFFNIDVVYEINSTIEKLEELEVVIGLMKLSKQKLVPNIK